MSDTQSQHSIEINFEDEIDKNPLINDNIKAVSTKKDMRRKVNKLNKDLFRRNINKILLGIPKLSAGRGLNGKFYYQNKVVFHGFI